MNKIILIVISFLACSLSFAHSSSELGTMVYDTRHATRYCMQTANIISSLSTDEILYSSFCAAETKNHSNHQDIKNTVFTKVVLPSVVTKSRYENTTYAFLDKLDCADNLQAIQLLGNNKNGISINAYCTDEGVMKSWIVLDDSYKNSMIHKEQPLITPTVIR